MSPVTAVTSQPVISKPSKPGIDKKNIHLLVRTRSVLACVLHWLLVLGVIALVITGYYISDPLPIFVPGEAYQAYVMGYARLIHFIAAGVVIAGLILRFYLAFTASCNRDILQFLPLPKNIIAATKLAWHYLTLTGKHEHYRFVNPLGGLGVFMISLSMAVMAITGLLLYLPGANPGAWGPLYGDSSITIMGTQQFVRQIHHFAMYLLLFFVVIHIYMQIWKNAVFTESDLSSIIGGYKIFALSDIEHFKDMYGLELDEEAPSEEEMEKASEPMEEGPGYH